MTPKTTLDEAKILTEDAVRELPALTPFGVGLHFSYHRLDKDQQTKELQRQQPELYTPRALTMTAFCADWIRANQNRMTPRFTSYCYAHLVEKFRRDGGDKDPYIHNGCFIACAIGLRLYWKVEGCNVIFSEMSLRQRVNSVLAADGQRLSGNVLMQTHDGPMMLPCKPRVVRLDLDLLTMARELGIL